MPIGSIRFNLETERDEYDLYMSAPDLHTLAWDFEMYLRNQLKHNITKDSEAEIVRGIQKVWFELCSDNDIKL